jgi:hypothetical protein
MASEEFMYGCIWECQFKRLYRLIVIKVNIYAVQLSGKIDITFLEEVLCLVCFILMNATCYWMLIYL